MGLVDLRGGRRVRAVNGESRLPSFDCEWAQGEVEELVCQNTELAALHDMDMT